MQRKELLHYLQELRDLEFAYWKFQKLYDDEMVEFEKYCQKIKQAEVRKGSIKTNGWTSGRKRGFKSCLIMSLLFLLMLIAGFIFHGKVAFKPLIQGMFIAGMLIFDGIALGIFMRVENEQRKQDTIRKETEKWKERVGFLEREKARLASLLEKNYDLNIIPIQYRDIASICYIYDYMSISNVSLEEALKSATNQQILQTHEEMRKSKA